MTKIFSFSSSRFTVSIIGRPNVGKSSLFNRLHAGKDSAIVSPEKGVTRDRKEGYSELFKVPVRIVDTAGIEDFKTAKILQEKMLKQTAESLSYSDLTLFLVDARTGITPIDLEIAKWLKTQKDSDNKPQENLQDLKNKSVLIRALTERPLSPNQHPYKYVESNIKSVILVANKCENEEALPFDISQSLYKLGLGEPLYVSSLDGTGLQDLLVKINEQIPDTEVEAFKDIRRKRREKFEAIKAKTKLEVQEFLKENKIMNIQQWEKDFDLANPNPSENSDFDEDNGIDYEKVTTTQIIQDKPGVTSENIMKKRPIMVSIIGRPNMGKSTLVNALIEQDRVVVDSQPGTTRDPVSIQWVYKGRKITLVDTAGIQSKTSQPTLLEKLIQRQTQYAIRYSNVVILLIDSLGPYRTVDLALAQKVVHEGRAVVAAVSKWDIVEQEYKPKIIKHLERQLDRNLTEVQRCPIQCISGDKQYGLNGLMDSVINVYEKWNTRISTGLLNDWLTKFKKIQNLPISDGDRLKIRFITQIKIRPPSFAIFINDSELFKMNYLKFLRQSLSKEFSLYGVPIRFYVRDASYNKEKKTLEKEHQGEKVKEQFLRHRRLARLAKQKLEQLDKARQKKKNT